MRQAGAGFIEGERTGKNNNIIQPKGSNKPNSGGSEVAELSSCEEVRQAQIDGSIIVAELSGGVREKESGEKVFGVDLSSDKLDTFFTESEIEELRAAESLSNPDKDRDIDEKSYDEMMDEWRAKVDEIYKEERKEYALKQAENTEPRDWMKPPEDTETVGEMDGKTFQKAMQKALSEDSTEEELARYSEEDLEDILGLKEEEPEIQPLDTETEELAARAFENRAKTKGKPCWLDIKKDIEMSDENTVYESLSENVRKVTTKDPKLKSHLRDPEGFEGDVKIERETGDTLIAVVSKED